MSKKKAKRNTSPKNGATRPDSHWRRDAGALALIAALTLVVFGRCVSFDYLLYDDQYIIFKNPHVMAGLTWEGVWWAFTNPNYGLYQPLPTVTYMLDRMLFGDWVGGFHATTMLWHLLCSCTFFLATRRLINNFPIAFTSALLFTVHPVQAAVVNWTMARNEIMPAFFILLSVDAYRQYATQRSRKAAGASLVFMLLAMMGKQGAVLLPLVLLLLDFWPLQRISISVQKPMATVRGAIALGIEKWPWLVVATAGAFLAFYGKYADFGVAERNVLWAPITNIGGSVVAYARYLFHFIYPFRHVFSYSASSEIATGTYAATTALFAGITAIALRLHTKRPYIIVGWGWFVLLLLPLTGLVEFAHEGIALRYMYLPSAGLYIIIACALFDKTARTGTTDARTTVAPNDGNICDRNTAPIVYWIAAGTLTAVAALLCFWQSGFWRDSETLALRALAVKNNQSAMAHNHLAIIREQQGRFDEVHEHHRAAADLEPDVALFQYNYTGILLQHQRFEEAKSRIEPFMKEKADNAGFLSHYGAALMGVGRLDEARTYLERAVEIKPDYTPALFNLAQCLVLQGQAERAMPHLETIIKARPGDARARELLASLTQLKNSKVEN